MIESTILSHLIYNEEYSRKVLPYIKEEYFDDLNTKKIFSSYSEYVEKYKEPPTVEALKVSIDNRKDIDESSFKLINEFITNLKIDSKTNNEWLLDETEKFCQDKDLYNAIRRSIMILDGKDKELDKGAIPNLLSDSLSVCFDSHIGHDFLDGVQERYEYYHRKEQRLEFDLDILNKITKGGLPKKSMAVLLSTTGAGKSLFMCHMAATSLLFGRNVLYITLELAEEEVARRIDANILDITLDEVKEMPLDVFMKRIDRIKSKTSSKLIIKEYPTGSAHSGNFRHLLNELRLKNNFVPDIVFVDYLNICASARVRGAAAGNSYTLVKSIAEEIRGLAMEFNVPIVTASQLNRSGYENSDVDLTNTSESMGITHTADFIAALITTEELESMGQLMIKQLKNRWGDLSYYRRFVIGINRSKMKLYNLEEKAQANVSAGESNRSKDEDASVFDKSKFSEEWNGRNKKKKKFEADDIS